MNPEPDRNAAIPSGMSPVFLPIGTVSENEVAILGGMGQLFVRGGSNSALDQYERWRQPGEQSALRSLIDNWVSLINERNLRVSAQGIKFFQTLIPEKSSLYCQHLPEQYQHIDGPTEALAGINREFAAHSDWYVDAFSVLSGDQSQYAMWPRTGSHWTPAGARALTTDIVDRISPVAAKLLRNIQLNSTVEIESDLGKHLLGPRVKESAPAPDLQSMPFGRKLTQIEINADESGKWSTWRCDDPLLDQRVIIFGNSYTQVVPLMDRLSWWFARTFRETKFVWTPEVQDDVMQEYDPDIVIAQGIERFLPVVPSR